MFDSVLLTIPQVSPHFLSLPSCLPASWNYVRTEFESNMFEKCRASWATFFFLLLVLKKSWKSLKCCPWKCAAPFEDVTTISLFSDIFLTKPLVNWKNNGQIIWCCQYLLDSALITCEQAQMCKTKTSVLWVLIRARVITYVHIQSC